MSIFEAKENSSISKNIGFAFLAQGVGFASSLLIALILPRFLGLEDYAFWQMFLLYSSYSGLALLGVNDGIYLRLGGKEYSTLDYRSLKTQLIIAYIFQLFIASIFCAFVAGGQFSDHYKTVLIMVAASGLIANLMSCLRYIFLSSNLTQIASMAEFFSKSFFLLSSLAALLFGFVDYRKYVLLYILSQLVALVYLMICAKKIISASCINLSDAIRLLASDSVVGLKIMISYYADILIMGFTRMATEWKFGLLVFGKLSFAFTITNFVLSFVAQIAMVFFPVLKRLKFESRALSYAQLRSILHLVLPLAYLAYIPLAIVLRIWVPEYSDSIVYLSFLMPLCVCSCKSNLLFNTFYKIERMEGHLCFINFVTMLLNALFAGLSIGVFNSVELAAFGVSLTVLIRDGIFEKTLSVKYGISFARPFVLEVVAALSFVFSFWALGVSGLLLVLLILAGYYLCSKPDFAAMRNSRDLFRKGA